MNQKSETPQQHAVVLRRQEMKIRLLRSLLKEASALLVDHHDAAICTFSGDCPVCSRKGREQYPDNIFGRIELAIELTLP